MIESFVMKVGLPLESNSTILLARAVFVHSVGEVVSDSGTLIERSTPRFTSWIWRSSLSTAASRTVLLRVVVASKSVLCVLGVTR